MPAKKRFRHLPPGFNAITPYLTVEDPDELLSFVGAAFGAKELKKERAVGPDGKALHAAFRIEGCILETGRASDRWKALPSGIHLYVRDVDATYASALKAGGESLHEVRDMEYGERSGAVQIPAGIIGISPRTRAGVSEDAVDLNVRSGPSPTSCARIRCGGHQPWDSVNQAQDFGAVRDHHEERDERPPIQGPVPAP